MSVDLGRVEELTDRVEEGFPRRPDESMGTWARRAFGNGYLNRDELDTLLAFCATDSPVVPEVEPSDDNAPAFVLANDRRKRTPWRPDAREPMRQRVLLSGLDACKGQRDLFATDGEA